MMGQDQVRLVSRLTLILASARDSAPPDEALGGYVEEILALIRDEGRRLLVRGEDRRRLIRQAVADVNEAKETFAARLAERGIWAAPLEPPEAREQDEEEGGSAWRAGQYAYLHTPVGLLRGRKVLIDTGKLLSDDEVQERSLMRIGGDPYLEVLLSIPPYDALDVFGRIAVDAEMLRTFPPMQGGRVGPDRVGGKHDLLQRRHLLGLDHVVIRAILQDHEGGPCWDIRDVYGPFSEEMAEAYALNYRRLMKSPPEEYLIPWRLGRANPHEVVDSGDLRQAETDTEVEKG